MVVYGHRAFRLNAGSFVRDAMSRANGWPSVPIHDEVVNLLVDWGEVESAIADALLPDRDDDLDALVPCRTVSDALADALCASWDRRPLDTSAAIQRLRLGLASLLERQAAIDVQARHAEGFAHYALYPEQYVVAADRFVDERAPRSVLCVGLRTIGSILAHVVAAALRRRGVPADARSVRPRGHPFDRRLVLGDRLRATFGASGAAHVAVVDEGPGLSGSSFAAAADALTELGVAPQRIVLFPSWIAPAESLRSDRARNAWTRHRKFIAGFDDVWIHTLEDLSGGAWRNVVFGASGPRPAVQPQHERRKYRAMRPFPTIFRFAGLGSRGSRMRDRALTLADAGFGASVGSLMHGFLQLAWVEGRPLGDVTESALNGVAAHIAFVHRTFATPEAESIDEIHEMASTNLVKCLDAERIADIDRLANAARAFDAPRVAIDGRMLPHEWILSGDRLLKVDALDHHDDDFWPGRRDIAWDVAGAIVELGLDRRSADYLLRRYELESGDRTIRGRLPFFEAAYLAYRAAYATLAAETLGDSNDGAAFIRLRERYRRSLAARLASSRQASRC